MSSTFKQPEVWTRQSIQHDKHRPSGYLPLGYEPGESISVSGSHIPPCSFEDVDRAVIKLFSEKLGFGEYQTTTKTGTKKWATPHVKFSSGERFAMSRRVRPDRDENGMLILPVIAIKKKAVKQTIEDTLGHGINPNTGEIVFKRELSQDDDDYQDIVNKLGLKNTGIPNSRRKTGEFSNDVSMKEGNLLDPKIIGNNIFEIIAIPQPQFYSPEYEITYWTNHIIHMNYMIQTTMNGFLPQDRMFRLNTPEGYWFQMYVDEEFSMTDDLDDFTDKNRAIEYTFTARVRAYLLMGSEPGQPIRIKRYYSCPFLSFDIDYAENPHSTQKDKSDRLLDKFTLSDVEPSKILEQERTDNEELVVEKTVRNPRTGKEESVFVQYVDGNRKKGESLYSVSNPELLERLIYR